MLELVHSFSSEGVRKISGHGADEIEPRRIEKLAMCLSEVPVVVKAIAEHPTVPAIRPFVHVVKPFVLFLSRMAAQLRVFENELLKVSAM
jgi:hypothetical protein